MFPGTTSKPPYKDKKAVSHTAYSLSSVSGWPSKSILIIIVLIFFICSYQYHLIHSARHAEETDLLQKQIEELKKLVETQAFKSKEEDASILGKLGGLHSRVSHHSKLLPELEEALSRHSAESAEIAANAKQQQDQPQNPGLNPQDAQTLNLLRSTYSSLTDKISSLEKMIGVLKQQDLDHIGHHEKFINPHLESHDHNKVGIARGDSGVLAGNTGGVAKDQILPLSLPGTGGGVGGVVPLSPPNPNSNSIPNPQTNNLRGGVVALSAPRSPPSPLSPPSPASHPLGLDTILLIIASANRPDYLKRTLEHVVKYHPGNNAIPIVISEDGRNPTVSEVVKAASDSLNSKSNGQVSITHIHHPSDHASFGQNGYYRLSSHFKWALNETFSGRATPQLKVPVSRVIILEEDLQIAPDFFEFFGAVAPLVDSDPSILCASAWNDNGQRFLVKDNKALFRSDFFPGLGWMLPLRIWNELSVKWPVAYWDDWLREPKQRQGRHTIRPEVCRTFHFGKIGVSNAQYSNYLDSIYLNEEFVKFSDIDLSYLQKDTWDAQLIQAVKDSVLVTMDTFNPQEHLDKNQAVRVTYRGFEGKGNSFENVSRW